MRNPFKAPLTVGRPLQSPRPPLVDHVLCGECPTDPEAYLCGTPRPPKAAEVLLYMGEIPASQPCPVCFAGKRLTCNSCGSPIKTVGAKR